MVHYDITPSKQASLPRYLYHQATFRPAPVHSVNLAGQTAIAEAKGAAAVQKLALKPDGTKRESGATVEVWKLDLFEYGSVLSFAKRAKETLERLDIIMPNAAMGVPSKRAFHPETRHDETLQVNYLSTALLATLLLPVVKQTRAYQPAPTRISLGKVPTWQKDPHS
ncbi:uncharacterized protein PODANS_4_355 [Podospora anserina S mat+]|uniref:Podospora anserina S mat+ genomic DNA chromosome 4, supercontig 1 n=1 Tax=Podospora anserina (strain S / ATCC MYA-4624 / DSM 980 / FGSC 10383) TaxID=515849 RepID=B2AD81_PODAN|nr:uncharacterized protein PODANS_4_355 [Podospora anserina S mat+]CAP61396.1 unnamed protein product [Podospora anserina S mat+]CDP27751.1 Putative protein of unknown function [Podospora anserina S mat+]